MLKRLFGRGKQPTPALSTPTQPTPPPDDTPAWGAPQQPFRTVFNLHLYGVAFDAAVAAIRDKYLPPAALHVDLPPSILIRQDGPWVTAHFAPDFAAKIGFNKAASELARALEIWIIGYRVYVEGGLDVHYFHNADHVAGLAMGDDDVLEREPESPATFAALADLGAIMPRPAAQHPLDYHYALLAGMGIRVSNVTWEEAQRAYADDASAMVHLP